MASDDPDFERKAADVIGLYVNPPQHAAVFCVDEKTAIQALDRLDPVLPLSPGRAERHGFEYYRHRSMLRSIPKAARSWVRPLPTIPPWSLWLFLGQIVALQPRERRRGRKSAKFSESSLRAIFLCPTPWDRRRADWWVGTDLVQSLVEARDERRLTALQQRYQKVALLIVDELGFVPFERAGGELLFNLLAQRYERRSTIITTNLAFSEWSRYLGQPHRCDAVIQLVSADGRPMH